MRRYETTIWIAQSCRLAHADVNLEDELMFLDIEGKSPRSYNLGSILQFTGEKVMF